MKCSVCGTECSESTRYCPTCGTPIETDAAPTQAMPGQDGFVQPAGYSDDARDWRAQPQAQQPFEPTRQMPPYQQPSGQFTRTGASQEFSAVPANPAMPGRSVDMSAATKSPKWPIVLICVLVVLIVALVLVIWHPWNSGAQSGTADVVGGSVVVTSGADGQASGDSQPAQQQASVGEQGAAEQPAAATDAFTQLSDAYNKLDGFHTQISSVATEFSDNVGVNDLTDLRNRAADLQSQISAARAALQAVAVDADSAYAQTKAAIDNLYNDLEMRISVLVQACDAVISGTDYSEILSRDNGEADEHGHTNRYLIDYERNYAAAQPVQG